ncbi:MAG: HAMP domain-containing histidine kinase [Alphaproteobacteria bacterium]|nr:HAMP domain-containing histidine kinase [Alphaproteobacteria bacterium]
MKKPLKARIRLRTILLIVNIMVFLLPLGGVMFFRLYENALVQQTENELITQAAVLAAVYKNEILKRLTERDSYGVPAEQGSITKVDDYYTPVAPALDLSKTQVLPPRGDGKPGQITAPFAQEVGQALTPVITEAQKTNLSGIKILDFNGVVVAGRQEVGLDLSDVPEVKRALTGNYTSVIRERISDEPPPALASISRGTGIRVFVALPILDEDRVLGVVYLSRTPQNILKHMYAEKGKVIIVGLILAGATLLIALLTSSMISRPINRLIDRTERFAAGDSKALHMKEGGGVQEIELLEESFTRMAHSLTERSEYIRTFAMHVSHEFKTPITAIQGSAELLLDHLDDMDEAKKRQFLENIISDSDRLKRLVSRLLELARADNTIISDDDCDPAGVLQKIRERYNETLKMSLDNKARSNVRISAENLETVLINLCDNALQNGADELQISVREQQDLAVIRLQDNGSGVSTANAAKIFTPFFTTRRQEGGTGIGLGIVTSIIHAYGGAVRLVEGSSGSGGACFEIILQRTK